MKTQELTKAELQAITGGADSSAANGVGLLLGTDSLLSLSFNWSDGQGRSYQSQLEIGKDINVGGRALGKNTQY